MAGSLRRHVHTWSPFRSRVRGGADEAGLRAGKGTVVQHVHGEVCVQCGERKNLVEIPLDLRCYDPRCPTEMPSVAE